MRDLTIKALASTAIPAIALMGSGAASAQEVEAPPEARSGNEIVVTARKVEESIQDVPVAITAFDAEEMQRRSISELEDVAIQTPGLVFEDYSNGGFGTPTIRGATQFAITALEQNVSVFLDGIYIPRQYAFDIGSMNLERIEVVKGPQSALYGANAFAGAINYVSTTRSLTDVSASGQLEVSENGGFDISGKISAPLVHDVLSMRLAVGYSEFGGDWENNHPNADIDVSPGTTGKIGGYEKQSVQVGASLKPFDALTLDFDYYNFDTDSETRAQYRLSRTTSAATTDTNCSDALLFGFLPVQQLYCGTIPSTPIPGVSGTEGLVIDPRSYGLAAETSMYRVHANLAITDQISADYQFGKVEGDVFSAGQSDRDALVGTTFGGNSGNVFSFLPSGFFDYTSHELRLQYQGDSGLYLSVGGFYQDGEDQDETAFGFVPLLGTDPIPTLPAGITALEAFTETETKAVFGRISVPLLDERLIVEAEGRYTDEEKQLNRLSTSPFTYTDSYFTPRGSISYKITPDNLIYASVAKGVKSGGINASTFAGLIGDERFYGPDTNWTYEIGMKNTFMNGRGTLNLALFLIDWSSLQLSTTPTGAPANTASIITNLGGAQSKGVEIDGQFEVVPGVTLNAGLAYIDATYDDGTISARITRASLCDDVTCPADGSIGGNDLQRTSKLQWNAGLSVDGDLSNSMEFFGRFDIAGQSKQYASEINVAIIEPRTLANARLGIRGDKWSASVWAKNVFDEKYVSNAFFIANPFQVEYVPTLGNRRRVGVTLSFDY